MAAPPNLGKGLAAPGHALDVPATGTGSGSHPTVPSGKPLQSGAGAVSVLTGGRAGQSTMIPAGQSPIDIQALRTMLVKAGYNIPAQGDAAGRLFKAALRDYLQPSASHPVGQRLLDLVGASKMGQPLVAGLRDPKSFNQRFGLVKGGKVTIPSRPPVSRLNPDGTPTAADVTAMDDAASGGGGAPIVDLTGLSRIAKGIGGIGSDIPLLPTSLADHIAGLAHDAKIRDLGIAGQRQTRDAAQSLEDIGHWYDQVGAARAAAATRDHAISDAGTNSVKDAVASIVSSLGGSANQGSGLVAASGADQAGLLSALGANEDQYNADLKPLLAAEGAGAKTRQQALNTKSAQDIQNQLLDEQGLRGQDKAAALLQILQANQGTRQANNQLGQTRFQDALAVEQAREAAALNGARIIDYTTKAAKTAAGGVKPAKGSFGASSTADRTSYTKDVLSQILPNGQLPKGMTRSKAISVAQRLARIYFPHGGIPNGTGLIASIVRQAGL